MFVDLAVEHQPLCKCCCTRRALLTSSLGGAALIGSEKMAQAVEGYRSNTDVRIPHLMLILGYEKVLGSKVFALMKD